jgi:CheY-like chemotaxis protein
MALSANAMQRDIEKGLQAGFFRYLTKPIKVGEFMDTLDLAFAQALTLKQQQAADTAIAPPPEVDRQPPLYGDKT